MTLHRWNVLVHRRAPLVAAAAAADAAATGTAAMGNVKAATDRCLPLYCPGKLARMLDWNGNRSIDCIGGNTSARTGTSDDCNTSHSNIRRRLHQLNATTQHGQWSNEKENFIVSLCIGRTHMDVTIASHPSCCLPIQALPSIPLLTSATNTTGTTTTQPIQALPSIPLLASATNMTTSTPSQHKRQSRSRIQREAAIQALTHALIVASSTRTAGCSIESNNTTTTPIVPTTTPAALLVSWPLQRDSGRCGAACGRVWHILDALWMTRPTSSSCMNIMPYNWSGIPTCLYDRHGTHCDDEDEWGRSPSHSRVPPSHMTQHTVSSMDQYWPTFNDEDDPCSVDTPYSEATLQWIDYCRVHWPQFPVILPLSMHHWDSLRSMPEKSGVENVEPSRRLTASNPSSQLESMTSMRRPLLWHPESTHHYTNNNSRLGGRYCSLDDATSRRQQRSNLLSERRRNDVLAAWIQSRATMQSHAGSRSDTIRNDTRGATIGTPMSQQQQQHQHQQQQHYGTSSSSGASCGETRTNKNATQNAA